MLRAASGVFAPRSCGRSSFSQHRRNRLMNRRMVLSLPATALVALLSSGQPVTAQAQTQGGGAPGGPGGFAAVRRPTLADPLHSDLYALVMREDVRSQILLTARQREALD